MIDIPEKSYVAKTDQNEHTFIQSKSPKITACTNIPRLLKMCLITCSKPGRLERDSRLRFLKSIVIPNSWNRKGVINLTPVP